MRFLQVSLLYEVSRRCERKVSLRMSSAFFVGNLLKMCVIHLRTVKLVVVYIVQSKNLVRFGNTNKKQGNLLSQYFAKSLSSAGLSC